MFIKISFRINLTFNQKRKKIMLKKSDGLGTHTAIAHPTLDE